MKLKMKGLDREELLKRRAVTLLELFSRQEDCPIEGESRSSRKEWNNWDNPKAFENAEKRATGERG